MDGEQLCFSLGVYKDKYFKDHEKALAKKQVTFSISNAEQNDENKDILPNDTKPAPRTQIGIEYDTDREYVGVTTLNDYTGIQLKAESADYDEKLFLKTAKLCSAVQCGHEDNPKTVTASVANVVEKWDFCFQKVQDAASENSEESTTGFKNVCVCFEKDNSGSSDNDLDENSFVDTILETTEKILLHANVFGKTLLKNGEAKKMLILTSSIKLVKNKVLFYKSVYGHKIKKDYMETELEDTIQGLFTQVTEYYRNMISSDVLHDSESGDWESSTPFYENQRISISIQFWAYTMQGLRGDFLNILPQSLAHKALYEILKRSLDILAFRYCQVKPSAKRLNQYKADISVILFVSHDMLLSLISDLHTLFHPNPRNVPARSVHQKCLALMISQIIVGCPIKHIERYIESLTSTDETQGPKKLEPLNKSEHDKLTSWLHLSFPGIYGHVPERLNTPSFLYLMGRMAAVQPGPNWAIMTRICLARDMEFPTIILKNFGAFIPGIRSGDLVGVRGLSRPCGHLLCNKRCIPIANIHWPQAVGSSVLYVVMHGNKNKEALKKVLSPLLSKLNPSAWSVLNKNMLWNLKRPVWLQGLIDLIEPYILAVVDEMMDAVESGQMWTLSHVPEAIMRLLSGLNEIACLIPDSFYEVCEMIKPLIPEEVTPACESVLVHIFVSGLYGVVNKIVPVFRAWNFQREKVDFLVAVGEKLCNLEANEDTRKLENIKNCSLLEPTKNWDEMPEEYATMASEMVADSILSEPHGQEALKTIHRFLCYNSEWLQKTLGVTVRGVDTLVEKSSDMGGDDGPKLLPWEDDIFRMPPPTEMIKHCGFYHYNALMNLSPAWDDCLRIMVPNMNPMLMRQLMKNRCEVNDVDNVCDADKATHTIVLKHLNDQLLDKVEISEE